LKYASGILSRIDDENIELKEIEAIMEMYAKDAPERCPLSVIKLFQRKSPLTTGKHIKIFIIL